MATGTRLGHRDRAGRGVVARPHERARSRRARSPSASAYSPDLVELLGRPPPHDRQVRRRRPQVLAERDDVDADAAQVGERAAHLVGRLAHAEDHARLRDEPRRLCRDRATRAIARSRPTGAPRAAAGPRSRGCGSARRGAPRRSRRAQPASPLQSEISTSTVVSGLRRAHRVDRRGEHRRAAVGEVVAGDAGDHHVREPERHHRVGDAGVGSSRSTGPAACGCRPGRSRTPGCSARRGS